MMWKTFSMALCLTLAATILSSEITSKINFVYQDIMGCTQGCLVIAGGWPFAYLVDYPGISPVGSVSIVNAVLGMDKILVNQMIKTFLFWFALIEIAVMVATIAMSRHKTRSS